MKQGLHKFLSYFCLGLMLLSATARNAGAEPGVDQDRIVFGQSAALTGPASALGLGMQAGILAAFKEANDRGGIHGHRLELISVDDGYEPDRALENVRSFARDGKVFAMIGGVGTPTANAMLPVITAEKMPMISQFSGAQLLREPFNRYVVNLRASYQQETEDLVARLTQDLGITRIGVLFQDDSYGRSGLSGVEKALKKRGMKLAGKATYTRNTVAVKSAVLSLRQAQPQAVIMVGTYQPCAAFIRLARQLGFDPVFANLSFVGSEALAAELGPDGQNVIISQVVPFPYDVAAGSAVARYRSALKAYDPALDYGFVSLEGYLAGRLAIAALGDMIPPFSREGFLDHIYGKGELHIDDLTLHYADGDSQGLDEVFTTVLQADGRFTSVRHIGQGGANGL